MSEPLAKRRKLTTSSKSKSGLNSSSTRPKPITDPRFASLQSDPRYRLPSKRTTHVQVDKRFSRVLKDEDFSRKARVDRYGRRIENDAERKRLKRQYDFEEDNDEGEANAHEPILSDEDSIVDDDEVEKELLRVEKGYDPLREGKPGSISISSSDESSSDEENNEADEELGVTIPTPNDTGIPMGEVTSRVAVVNLDWDNIHAADLMAVFSSFLPTTGRLLKVSIYPSEFGKERMEREEMEGPPKELFASTKRQQPERERAVGSDEYQGAVDREDDGSEDEEDLKSSLLNQEQGNTTDFNSTALRNYQLSRLRYFYAILTFSSPATAKTIYDACDGTEYLSSANFFDLRFVPDDTDFSDKPREECGSIPPGYRPNEFVTDALQHSRVKLTWDAEDEGKRREIAARAFRMGKDKKKSDIQDNDLQAYLGSSSSSGDEFDATEDGTESNVRLEPGGASRIELSEQPKISKKEQERQRMRALLGLAPEPMQQSQKKSEGPVGNLQITFSAGLTTSNEGDDKKKRSVFENSPEDLVEETTVEKYVRKERERKARRREKMRATRPGEDIVELDRSELMDKGQVDEEQSEEDLGFEDPFFAEPDAKRDRISASKMRKEERRRKREEREREEEVNRKERERLRLLMDDDHQDPDDHDVADTKVRIEGRHFDMAEIERQEKKLKKQRQKQGEKKRGKGPVEPATATSGEQVGRKGAADPRFSRLYSEHDYAIDPTNPRFRDTEAMRLLLSEARRRRNDGKGELDHEQSTRQKPPPREEETRKLVDKLKSKSRR